MEQIKGAEPLKNLRHEEFCHEYLKTLSPAEAGKATGYKNRQNAWDVLQRDDVQERIAFLNTQRMNRVDVDADYVLKRLVEIDQMDVLDIMDEKLNMKPLNEWPLVWRQYVNSIENMEITDSAGWMRKIKWPDKVKNLELIGKHIAVGAFKEKIEHSGTIEIQSLSELMDELSEGD